MSGPVRLYATSGNIRGPLRRAPEWVRSIDPAEINRQQQLGFPDMYGDDFCEECGQRNPTWWVAPEMWDVVTDGERGNVLCPSCFAFAWQQKSGREATFELRVHTRDEEREAARVSTLGGPAVTAAELAHSLLDQARRDIREAIESDARVFRALSDYFADRDVDADAEDVVRALDEAIDALKAAKPR